MGNGERVNLVQVIDVTYLGIVKVGWNVDGEWMSGAGSDLRDAMDDGIPGGFFFRESKWYCHWGIISMGRTPEGRGGEGRERWWLTFSMGGWVDRWGEGNV